MCVFYACFHYCGNLTSIILQSLITLLQQNQHLTIKPSSIWQCWNLQLWSCHILPPNIQSKYLVLLTHTNTLQNLIRQILHFKEPILLQRILSQIADLQLKVKDYKWLHPTSIYFMMYSVRRFVTFKQNWKKIIW